MKMPPRFHEMPWEHIWTLVALSFIGKPTRTKNQFVVKYCCDFQWNVPCLLPMSRCIQPLLWDLVIEIWCISLVSLSANIAIACSDCSCNRNCVLKHCAIHVYCVGQSTLFPIKSVCMLYILWSNSWHCRLPSCGSSQSSRVTLLAPTFSSISLASSVCS